jgi:hypothetical protein
MPRISHSIRINVDGSQVGHYLSGRYKAGWRVFVISGL